MFYLYYVVLSPKIPCPNCQEDEWLENNELELWGGVCGWRKSLVELLVVECGERG